MQSLAQLFVGYKIEQLCTGCFEHPNLKKCLALKKTVYLQYILMFSLYLYFFFSVWRKHGIERLPTIGFHIKFEFLNLQGTEYRNQILDRLSKNFIHLFRFTFSYSFFFFSRCSGISWSVPHFSKSFFLIGSNQLEIH